MVLGSEIAFMLAIFITFFGLQSLGKLFNPAVGSGWCYNAFSAKLTGTNGLKCHQCGWDSCGTNEELVECSLERVNQVHGHLQRLVNLSQYHEVPSPTDFVCFELQLTNLHGNRSGTVKSCTLQAAQMCELNNWQTVKVVGCKTCNDRDYCNGFETIDSKRDVSGVGFNFSAPRRSVATTGSATPNSTRASPWSYALMLVLVFCVHRLLVKQL
ncbi:AGAP013056-PA-like protein [Anopheles sinensis]|uniref:AGAP013056-PA-like protein n=1 Tax=Anopheles sinensis TaxID=74873 RepID=A0A084W0D2_ANOSI|nr:AGAP013056-PA-like protein [Anopheles sinensis]